LKNPTRFYDGYIFDLDGTLYLGDALLPTVKSTIEVLRAGGRKTVYLSNNPTQSRQSYARKLTRLGLPTNPVDVINSSAVMVDYLNRHHPEGVVFVAGEQSLIDELDAAGYRLSEQAGEIDIVIASFDRTFEYRKLQIAFDAIRAGARFYATNADAYCPVPPAAPGEPAGGEPDAAAVIAAIEACTGKQVEVVVGKPSREMATAILAVLDIPPERCLMTGDRLETDVAMGLNAGMDAALVLTGATDWSAVQDSPIQPTYILEQLVDLLPIDPSVFGLHQRS
jgi:NagD protein